MKLVTRTAFLFAVVVFGASVLRAATPDAIVAADGSAQYKTVQAAINAAPQTTTREQPWTILVKAGTYKEVVYIQREKRFVHLVGEDASKTVITYSLNAGAIGPDGEKIGTFRTPTVQIDADDFTVENLTLENAAGATGQALAVRVDGDRVIFRGCRFLGWQDTILINRGRQYFENCFIAGATDFIFGGATAWFENCELHIAGNGFITAASTPPDAKFGYVFNRCRITAISPEVKTYLGRPWRSYASTIFLRTEMAPVVRTEGWQNWGKPEREKTVRYAEYASTGEGAPASGRVAWAKALTDAEASAITLENVLGGTDNWRPAAAH
ncbi:MAG: pectinesterase family protein [Nibricoccus sp.]